MYKFTDGFIMLEEVNNDILEDDGYQNLLLKVKNLLEEIENLKSALKKAETKIINMKRGVKR